jgi:hypothetical protein
MINFQVGLRQEIAHETHQAAILHRSFSEFVRQIFARLGEKPR